MAWPYDELDGPQDPSMPRFVPGGMASAFDPQMPGQGTLPPLPEPNYPMELQGPQEPPPDDFFSRLAMSSGPEPFSFRPRPNPTGLEVLLSILSSFGNAKAAKATRNISEVDQRNQRARESAKELAKHRWELRKEDRARVADIAAAGAKRAQQRADTQEQREYDQRQRDTPPSPGELQGITARNAAVRAGKPLAPRAPRAVKPGPVMPELASAAASLRRKSVDMRASVQTAKADSLRDLSDAVDNLHAQMRQAQSLEDLASLEIPDGMPPDVVNKVVAARKNRERQLGATR